MRADEIVPGDVFRWCGHNVTAKDVHPKPRKLTLHPRHARVIVIDSPVESVARELCLHYYDDEQVDLACPPRLAPYPTKAPKAVKDEIEEAAERRVPEAVQG